MRQNPTGEHFDQPVPLIDAGEVYENAPCGYFSLSPEGRLIRANRTLLNWLGYNLAELIGQKFTTLLPKGGQMHFEMFFMPLAKVNKKVKELSYEILRKDGSVMPVLLNASVVADAGGKVLVINNIVTDNSERKQYEQDLLNAKRTAESERKRLQFMADLVPEMIWTATAKGNLEYVNARFCQYFNCDRPNIRSSFILSKVHPTDQRIMLQNWFHSLVTGNDLQMDLRLVNLSGQYEWHLLKASKFLDEEGNLTNWFGSCTNIDEHVNALKKKDEFINIASHELKTPITSLKAVLQLLERLKSDPTNKMIPSLIEKANRNIDKVNSLVEDLLNASQLNDGRLHLNKTMFNMTETIGDSVHHVRLENKYEVLTLGAEVVNVFADEARIEQVINNFISNAIKYAPESKEVIVKINDQPDTVMVEVIDKGPGIAAEKIPYLFDRYYQVDTKGSRYSGLGLGLFICSEIIKRHGGGIGVKSEEGIGSTFWFSLPKA